MPLAWRPARNHISARVVAAGILTDYLAFVVFVTLGAALEGVSMFYSLASPVRVAPLVAGAVTGALAAGHAPSRHRHRSDAVRSGLVHGGAVVAFLLAAGLAGALARSSVWFVLPVTVLAVGVRRALAVRAASALRAGTLLVGTALVALFVALPAREPLGMVLSVVSLLPRAGAYVFFLPAEFRRGWTLVAVWAGILLLGSAVGSLGVARRTKDASSGR